MDRVLHGSRGTDSARRDQSSVNRYDVRGCGVLSKFVELRMKTVKLEKCFYFIYVNNHRMTHNHCGHHNFVVLMRLEKGVKFGALFTQYSLHSVFLNL